MNTNKSILNVEQLETREVPAGLTPQHLATVAFGGNVSQGSFQSLLGNFSTPAISGSSLAAFMNQPGLGAIARQVASLPGLGNPAGAAKILNQLLGTTPAPQLPAPRIAVPQPTFTAARLRVLQDFLNRAQAQARVTLQQQLLLQQQQAAAYARAVSLLVAQSYQQQLAASARAVSTFAGGFGSVQLFDPNLRW